MVKGPGRESDERITADGTTNPERTGMMLQRETHRISEGVEKEAVYNVENARNYGRGDEEHEKTSLFTRVSLSMKNMIPP